MKIRLHKGATGRPQKFVFSQAAACGCTDLEAVTAGRADVVAGDPAIWERTGLSLKDLECRGSILPDKDGGWFVATIDPRTCLTGPKKYGYKNMTQLVPSIQIDLTRSVHGEPSVPKVHVRSITYVLTQFKLEKPKYVSIDIEGQGENLHLIGIGWSEDEAYVVPWTPQDAAEITAALRHITTEATPIFHNANYDVPELELAGLPRLKKFEDTIVLAALYNPGLKKGLQSQVLSWVDGTTAWKGLVNHKYGHDYTKGKVATYRQLWTTILTRLGRNVPKTGYQWYCFYNGLDVAYTFRLHAMLRWLLTQQGRLDYYDDLLKPLHPHLVDMGLRGLPVDEARRDFHRRACERLERMAAGIVREAGNKILEADVSVWTASVALLRSKAVAEERKLGADKLYCSARNKLRQRQKNLKAGFNMDSWVQRAQLVYDHLGLPEVNGARGTDEDSFTELLGRLTRTDLDGAPCPTAKPAVGTIDEAARILRALIAGKKWGTWRRNFLAAPLQPRGNRLPRLLTEYHLHRTATGRLSSGASADDDDKKEKKQQLQNVPEKLRDPIIADPGMVMVGGDLSNIEWAVVQWYAINVPDYIKDKLGIPLDFHEKLLDRFLARKLDAHRYLASVCYKVDEAEVTKYQRKSVKAYTHGRNYYGAPRTLGRNAGHDERTAKQVCQAHAKAFMPQGWWQHTLDTVNRQRYVETAGGWRRWFFEMKPKPTEALASQIQGTAADLCKYVLLDMFRTCPPGWEILTTTHDSFLMQVPEEAEEEAVAWLKDKMEQPIPFLGNTQFLADVQAGRSWRDV